MIPFPRITFGYFFDSPFAVTNHSINETIQVEMIISRISTNQISVTPLTDHIKIIGAHIKPYALAFLTNENISKLPWVIQTKNLFKKQASHFKEQIDVCKNPTEMFKVVENSFLESVLNKDLNTIVTAIEIIEQNSGSIEVSEISKIMDISNRTLRNHFYKNIGCSPKEYMHLVKLKKSVYQMKNSNDSLTSITYAQNYSDQSHFTKSVKKSTGLSPKEIQKKIPDFRFLQF